MSYPFNLKSIRPAVETLPAEPIETTNGSACATGLASLKALRYWPGSL